MKIFRNITHILTLLTLIISCTKEEPQLPESESADLCPEMYEVNSSFFYDTLYKGDIPNVNIGPFFNYMGNYIFESVTSNPMNPFEIAFSRVDSEDLNSGIDVTWEICVYNFCSNELNIITTTESSPKTIDWGVKNHIILFDNNFKLFFPNGNKALDINVNGFDPKFSPDGSKILFKNIGGAQIFSIHNEEVLDVLTFNNNAINWLNNEELIYASNSGVFSYNLANHQSSLLFNNILGIGQITHRGNKVFLVADGGIYEYEDNTTTLIEESYQTFGGFTPHYLSNNLILQIRYVRDTTGISQSNTVKEYSYINILNQNTNEERIIDLPE